MKTIHIVRELDKIEQYLFLPEAFYPMPQQREQLYGVCSTLSTYLLSQ